MNSNLILDEQLINAVRENEVLYNKFSKSYKNIALKSEVWKKIGTALGMSEHECVTRWKSLRDKYMREKKSKENMPSGSAFHAKPEWHLYKELNFLPDFVRHRKSSGNYTEIETEVDTVLDETEVFELGDNSTSTELFDVLDDYPSTSNSNASSGSKKRKNHLVDDQPSTSSASKKRKDSCMNTIEQHLTGTMSVLKTFMEKSAQDSNANNSKFLNRVDVLLGGLRSSNRDIAEKKVIEYLCKCQIVDLNDGSIENININ